MFAKSLMRWPLGFSRPLSMLSSSSSSPWTKPQTTSPSSRRGGFLATEAKGVLKDHRHNIFNVSFTQKYKTRLLDSFFFHKSVVRYSKDSSKGGKGDKRTNIKVNNVDLKSISSDEVFLLEEIKCPHCDFEFKNTGALQNHLDSTGKLGGGGCEALWRQRNEAEVKAGNLKHICDECGKGFKKKSELEKHNIVHKEKDIKEDWEEEGVKCPHCHIGFANEDILGKHFDLTGKNGGGGCKVLWKIKNKADVDAGKLKHVCDFDGCDIGFKWKSELERHKASHSDERPFVCSECGNSYKLQGHLDQHVREKHSGQVFECPECDKTFNSKGDMKKHLKSCRQEEKDFKCSQCGLKFHTNSQLTLHIKHVHTKERPHKCELCDYSCTTKADLEKHIRSVHEKARPHQCEDCSAAFSTAGDLKVHRIRHHTFDWPLTCHVCEERGFVKGFIVPNQLEKHMKAKHPEEYQEQMEREKPAVCPVCDKRFKNEMQVGIHIKKKHV